MSILIKLVRLINLGIHGGKTIMDVGFIFLKTNPYTIVGGTVYGILDMSGVLE